MTAAQVISVLHSAVENIVVGDNVRNPYKLTAKHNNLDSYIPSIMPQ